MKKKFPLLALIVFLVLISCNNNDDTKNDDEFGEFLVARPLVISNEEFRSTIDIVDPIPIEESGKIYAYNDYVFVNDKYQGIHIIDNTNPAAPQKIGFIEIPGNVDISVKDDFLYADSITDLVVLDISDIQNITQVNRLENVLQDNIVFPLEADIWEQGSIDWENEIIIGWETAVETRRIDEVQQDDILFNSGDVAVAESASDGGTGQGGSLARFKIVDDYLYAVDSHNINIFDISNLDAPQDLPDVHAGFDIETIFNRGEYLFLGKRQGMSIFSISNPAEPQHISEFQHGTACDPVVVDDKYAYVTLRGGNFCGATESGLYIVDIQNIEEPELLVIYPMDEPYGLGIKGDQLFVCDGASGLKVYDKSSVPDLPQLNHFDDIITFDVIPLENNLLMIGGGVLYQYEYLENDISLISTFNLE